ncbi:50S ribosomal protein L16 [Candidatus Vidania fulgoroideorum]
MSKRRKFTKFRKGRNKGVSQSGNNVVYLKYGIKSLEKGFLNKSQIESSRIVLNKIIKKEGKIIIRINPDYSRTKKPIEVRMGNGKGEIEKKVFRVLPGKIIFEVDCEKSIIKKAYKLLSYKLPIKVKLEKRNIF